MYVDVSIQAIDCVCSCAAKITLSIKIVCVSTHPLQGPTTVIFSSSNLLFIGGRSSSCFTTLFFHLSKNCPLETHRCCAHLLPVHTQNSTVRLRLINKSKILPALLSQTTICSMWDVDSAWCIVYPARMPCFITGCYSLPKLHPGGTHVLPHFCLLASLPHLSFSFCKK